MKETGLSAKPNRSATSVDDFVGAGHTYYVREFEKIQSAVGFPRSWNTLGCPRRTVLGRCPRVVGLTSGRS